MELAKEYTLSDQENVNNKELRAFNLFWIGFIIYTSAYVLFTVLPYDLILNKIQIAGLLLITFGIISLIHFKFDNNYLKVIYILYCGWQCYTISRGFTFDRKYLYNFIFDAWFGVLPYFVPIILLLPKNIIYLKKLFVSIGILGLFFVVCSILYRKQLGEVGDNYSSQMIMEIFSKTLSIPCGFLLITYIYQPNKRKILAFIVIALTLLLALIRARRAITFMCTSYLLIFYIIYLYVNKIRISNLIFSLSLIGLLSFAGYKYYNENKKGTFSLISERVNDDTRTPVEDCFYEDMKMKDWIIGKGMMGEYYCPNVDDATDENNYTDYRSMIETDYLNIILKGGIISLGLLLLIAVPAVFKGLFYSKNILSKAAALWILLWIIDLYPATVTTFTLNYILVWVSIGICYSKKIRNMSESAIKEIISS